MSQPAPAPTPSTESALVRAARVAQSIKVLIGCLVGGPLLLLGGLFLLNFSENWVAQEVLALDAGQRRAVAADFEKLNPALEGKLVCVSGTTIIAGPVRDELSGIEVDGVRLERVVEMLQWVAVSNPFNKFETEWRTEWRTFVVDSTKFKPHEGHHNPNYFPVQSATKHHPQIEFGAYQLSASQVNRIPATELRTLTADEAAALSANLMLEGHLTTGEFHLPVAVWLEKIRASEHAHKLNPAFEPDPPVPGQSAIGDIRIRYEFARPGELTVVAQQAGNTLRRYPTTTGELELVAVGKHDIAAMFGNERADYGYAAWFMRGLSLFCVTTGCIAMVSVFSTLAWLTGATIELPVMRLGCAGSILLSTVVVVVAWQRIDPVFTGVCVGLAVLLLGGIGWSFRKPRLPPEEVFRAELSDRDR